MSRYKYVSAGNFVVFAVCVALFRFYGDSAMIGKFFLALSAFSALFSMAYHALAIDTLNCWIENSFADQHFPEDQRFGSKPGSDKPAHPFFVAIFGSRFEKPDYVSDFGDCLKDIENIGDRATNIQLISIIAFSLGFFFFLLSGA